MPSRQFWTIAVFILVMAIAARVGIALTLRPWTPHYEQSYVYGDPRVFHEIATELAMQGYLSEYSLRSITVFAPGYPVFLSFIYRVFGVNIPVAVFINCLLSGLSCLLMILLVRPSLGEKAALAAGALLAFHPHSIRFAPLLYSETLFIFLSTCLLLAFVLGKHSQEAKQSWFWGVFVASIFAAVTVPTRIGMLYFAPFLGLLWYLLTSSSWRLGLVRWGVFMLLFVVWLSPWAIHNKLRYDTYRLSVSGEYNFLALFVAGALTTDGESARRMAKHLLKEAEQRAREDGTDNPFEMGTYYFALAWEKIQQNPTVFFRASVKGFFNFWFRAIMLGSDERSETIKRDLKTQIYVYYSWVFQLALFTAWIAGLLLWRRLPKVWVALSTVSVLYFALVLGNAAYSRFFMQALPFIIPLAGLLWANGLFAIGRRVMPNGAHESKRQG